MIKNEYLIEHELSEVDSLKVHSRLTGSLSPLSLLWTGRAIEISGKGSEL